MGVGVSQGMTQYDVEEVIKYSGDVFTQIEVLALYRRFRSLDRGKKGYVSGDEIHNIPELSINPLAQRITRLFDNVNFKEFVKLLAPFSPKADREQRLQMLFQMFDIDGDGLISAEELEIMLRQIAGTSLDDDQLKLVVAQALREADAPQGIDYKSFKAALEPKPLDMVINIPEED